ncbi:hypothetical protein FOZ63_000617, partial [Perkinsus olseni]
SGSVLRTTTSGAQTQDSYPAQGHMPFKLESVLDPFTGDGDFALWSREFDTVGEASRWNPRQKAQYLVLFMKGSAKDVARQALDEVEDEAENDRVYTHVVRRLGQAFSLKTGEAWRLLTTRSWRDEDTVDGVLAEFKRYLRVLGVTSTAASDILLKESVMKSLPAEVRRAVEAFEEDGKELSLNDVTAKARTLLKVLPKPTQQVAAAVTSGKYCYACKTTGHTAKECGQSGVQPRGPKKQDKASGVKRVKCFACHQRGHFARDFPTRSAAKQAAGAAHAEKDFPKARRSSDEAVLQMLDAAVDTGCDISLVSSEFVKGLGVAIDTTSPMMTLTQMDGTGKLQTLGVVNLVVTYHKAGTEGVMRASHFFHVVTTTVFGPVVIGADFASVYLQGMRWDGTGCVCVGGATRASSIHDTTGDSVAEQHRVGNLPGVYAQLFESGRVVITADDFILSKDRDDSHFTCKWIWLHGEPPSPMVGANRGDHNPSLTVEEEGQVKAEVEKMISNGWIAPFDGDVHNILPWVLVSQQHRRSTPLRMCLDFRRLNQHIKSEPVRGIVNCAETLHR